MRLSSILVVVPDQAVLMALIRCLEAATEYSLIPVATQAAATEQLAKPGAQTDAIILDSRLPDGEGRQFCADLRQQGCVLPIILLDDAADEDAIVAGLSVGATDYIVKPFRPGEMAARLRAALRSHVGSRDAAFTIGHYTFRPATKTLHEPGKRRAIRLTDKETRLLRYLHDANGAAVERGSLMTECWGYVTGMQTHTVESHVYRLRQKIEANPKSPRILLTAPGGYRLSPPVES